MGFSHDGFACVHFLIAQGTLVALLRTTLNGQANKSATVTKLKAETPSRLHQCARAVNNTITTSLKMQEPLLDSTHADLNKPDHMKQQ